MHKDGSGCRLLGLLVGTRNLFLFLGGGGGGGGGGVGWCRVSRFKVLSWWLVENEGIGCAESRDYEETDPVLDLLLTTSDGQQV